LLRLPAELRNKIYEHAVSDITVRITIWPSIIARRSKKTRTSLALLSTCRQIQYEATKTFYAVITIEIASDWDLSWIGKDMVGLATRLRVHKSFPYEEEVTRKKGLTSLQEVCVVIPRNAGILDRAAYVEDIRADFRKPILRSQLRTELGEKKKKQYRLYRVHNGAVIDH
jgi:hypothetical protein